MQRAAGLSYTPSMTISKAAGTELQIHKGHLTHMAPQRWPSGDKIIWNAETNGNLTLPMRRSVSPRGARPPCGTCAVGGATISAAPSAAAAGRGSSTASASATPAHAAAADIACRRLSPVLPAARAGPPAPAELSDGRIFAGSCSPFGCPCCCCGGGACSAAHARACPPGAAGCLRTMHNVNKALGSDVTGITEASKVTCSSCTC